MDRFDRIEELFLHAIELPDEDRDDWLLAECGDDQSLLEEVRAMLQEDAREDDPLEAGLAQLSASRLDDAKYLQALSQLHKSDILPESLLSTQEFIQLLSDIKLVSDDDLDSWSKLDQESSSATSLASQLVEQGKITRYQASVLLSGHSEQLVIDKYLILDAIDSGGMGIVYKAVHRPMNRVVALKMLPQKLLNSQDKVNRFRREVRVAATLVHPNIVMAHDADESNGVHFLVMEYVSGRDLRKLVAEEGTLSASQAVDILLQTADALKHAHAKKVIHRDIKPKNIMLSRDGDVKVLDMGLARITAEDLLGKDSAEESEHDSVTYIDPVTENPDLTQASNILGTPSFMAPEQAIDAKGSDERTDIYSLGCTLYYILTGEPPYSGKNHLKTILLHKEADIPSLCDKRADIPDSFDAAFQKMLAKDPADRYQTIQVLIEAVEACEVPVETSKRQRSRRKIELPIPDTIADQTLLLDDDQSKLETRLRPSFARRWGWTAIASLIIVGGVFLADGILRNGNQTDVSKRKFGNGNDPGGEPEPSFSPTVSGRFDSDQVPVIVSRPDDVLPGLRGPINALTVTPNERFLISVADGRNENNNPVSAVSIHDLQNRDFVGEVAFLKGASACVCLDNQRVLISRSFQEHQFEIRSIPDLELLTTFGNQTDWCREIALTGDQAKVVSVNQQARDLKIWDLATGEVLANFPIAFDLRRQSLSVSRDHFVAFASDARTIQIVDTDTFQSIQQLEIAFDEISLVRYRLTGNQLFVGGSKGELELWDLDTNRRIQSFAGHEDQIYSGEFLNQGDQFVTGSSDNTVRVWDIISGIEICRFEASDRSSINIAITSTEKTLLSAGGKFRAENRRLYVRENNNINVWNLPQKHELDHLVDVSHSSIPEPTPPRASPLVDDALRPVAKWMWTPPVKLKGKINSEFNDDGVFVSSDGLTMLFFSDREKQGNHDLWIASRSSVREEFSNVQPVNGEVNSEHQESHPCLSNDGLRLYFCSNRPGGKGREDFWMSERDSVDDPFRKPVNLPGDVNSAGRERVPVLSSDELTIIFSANRPGDNKSGLTQLYVAKRESLDVPFGEPVALSSLNSDGYENPGFLSVDDQLLLFSTSKDNIPEWDFELWWAARAGDDREFEVVKPLVDINRNRIHGSTAGLEPVSESLYFSYQVQGEDAGANIYVSRRIDPGSYEHFLALTGQSDKWKWSLPVRLSPSVNSPNNERHASLSHDGLRLLYTWSVPGNSHSLIQSVTRESVSEEFTGSAGIVSFGYDPSSLEEESAVNEEDPWLSHDGQRIYFKATSLAEGFGGPDLWMAERTPHDEFDFSSPINLGAGVNSRRQEWHPVLTEDELMIVFSASFREDGKGYSDLYFATRESLDEQFGPAQPLSVLNTPGHQVASYLSPDGRLLLYSSSGDEGGEDRQLWAAYRPDIGQEFGRPVLLPQQLTSNGEETKNSHIWLSQDGFEAIISAADDGDADIYRSRLIQIGVDLPDDPSVLAMFGLSDDWEWTEPEKLPEPINSPAMENWCSLSGDGLSLVYTTNRHESTGMEDIWIAQRRSTDDSFSSASPVPGPVNRKNFNDARPWLSSDKLRIYFTTHIDSSGLMDICVAERNHPNEEFGVPTPVAEINSGQHEWTPILTDDELTIVFSSSFRPGSLGMNDLYMATRRNRDEPFGSPQHLKGLSSEGSDDPKYLSPDGRLLIFVSSRGGGSQDRRFWGAYRSDSHSEFGKPLPLATPISTTNRDYSITFDRNVSEAILSTGDSPESSDLYRSNLVRKGTVRLPNDPVIQALVAPSEEWEWTNPVNLGQNINSSSSENCPHLSTDGLRLYFVSNREALVTSRESTSQVFRKPESLRELGMSYASNGFTMDSTELIVIYSLTGRSEGLYDLWMATRKSRDQPFSSPRNLGPKINTPGSETFPTLSGDGCKLVFTKSEESGKGDLYLARRDSIDDEFNPPVRLGRPVSTGAWEGAARMTSDGSLLFYGSGPSPNNMRFYMSIWSEADATFVHRMPLVKRFQSDSFNGGLVFSRESGEVYFASSRHGSISSTKETPSINADLWYSRLLSRKLEFPTEPTLLLLAGQDEEHALASPVQLPLDVNSRAWDRHAEISADGQTLYFSSTRSKGAVEQIFFSVRESLEEEFGLAEQLILRDENIEQQTAPSLTDDETVIVFGNHDDLWIAKRDTKQDQFATPEPLDELNSEYVESTADISDDGLTLVFSSDRPGGLGNLDLWMTSRDSLNDPFRKPINLGPTVNSAADEVSPEFVLNGRGIVFQSDFETKNRIMVSEWNEEQKRFKLAHPVLDFEGKEILGGGPSVSPQGELFLDNQFDQSVGFDDIWMMRRAGRDQLMQ